MKIGNPDAEDDSDLGLVQRLNDLPYANRPVTVYDGSSNST